MKLQDRREIPSSPAGAASQLLRVQMLNRDVEKRQEVVSLDRQPGGDLRAGQR